MPERKFVSAKTKKITYPDRPSSQSVSAPSGPSPALPSGWSVTPQQERKEFIPGEFPSAPGERRVSVSLPPEPAPKRTVSKSVSGITSRATRTIQPIAERKKPKAKTYVPRTIQESKTISQAVDVGARSLGESIKFLFPVAKGEDYTQEELRKWKKGETAQQFKERTKRERTLESGISLALGAIPVGKGAKVIEKTALPVIKGTGQSIFGKLVGGLGRQSIYAEKGLISKAGTKLVEKTVRLGKKSIYTEPLTKKGVEAGAKGILSSSAKFLADRPLVRAGVAFGQAVVAPDIFAATATSLTTKPKTSRKLSAEEEGKISEKAFGEASYLVEFKEVKKAKKVGEKIVTETEYVPTVPGVDVPGLGYLSPLDLIPAQQVLPGGIGEKFGKDYRKSVTKQLTDKGWSKKEAKDYAVYLDKTQRQARGYGGAYGLLSIGVGEEALAQRLFRKGLTESGKAATKALTKKEAAKLIGKKITTPLLTAGAIGGSTSVIVEQRMQQQELNPFLIGFGALLGSASAYALGKPIATKAITSPTQSKILYGAGSILDPFELPADIIEGRIAKRLGQKEFKLRIRTPSVSVGTPSILPSVTGTPSYVLTPSKPKGVLITPSVVPEITPSVTPEITPSVSVTPEITPITELPSYIATPIESVTETPTETTTATITPTPTGTITSVFVPTFTAPFIPFLPPLISGGQFKKKQTKRERTRFIDEFTLAFAGLARPLEPVYFGKQKPTALARRQAKTKKRKQSKRGGGRFDPEALARFFV